MTEKQQSQGWARRLLCRLGLHEWRILRITSRGELESMVRNEVRGRYCGVGSGGDWIVDQKCECCGYVDNQIEHETIAIKVREERVWDRLQKVKGQAK